MSSVPLVYVVDDSATIRNLVSIYLRGFGCEPLPLENAEACLKALETQRPIAILMDLRMDPIRGDDCCRRIKELPAFADVPVVMLTGEDSAPEIMRTWRAGADDFLPKPIRPAQLASKLRAIRDGVDHVPSGLAPLARKQLLLADGSVFFRRVLGTALEQSGFRLLYARNGTEALELGRQHAESIDALVLDVFMPGMDGVAVLKALRGVPRLAATPAQLMSARELPVPMLQEAQALSGRSLLAKSALPPEALVARICTLVQLPAPELRACERKPFFSVVEFQAATGGDWMSGFSYDVSTGGIFVRTLTPLEPDEQVELKVKFGAAASLSCRGQVSWRNSYRQRRSFAYPVGMGVRFTRLDGDQTALVQSLVKSSQWPGLT